MKTKPGILILLFLAAGALVFGQKYSADWQSLRRVQTPEWLQKGKFGIYTHWGPYAVHAYGSNTTWYSFALYLAEDGEEREHFEKTFGELTPEYGYKDLIPLFTADKFDADEWADLFKKAGTRYAGPEPAGMKKKPMGEIPSLVGKTISEELSGELYKMVFMDGGKVIFSGGEVGDGLEGSFKQDGEEVYIEIADEKLDAIYDGEKLIFEEESGPAYPGFYKEEIKRVSLLGDGQDLKWSLTPKGLIVEMPENKPCDHAYVLKIERHHHPRLK